MSEFATEIVDTTTGNVTKAASVAVDEICARCKHPCKESKHAEDIKLVQSQKNTSCSVVIPEPRIEFVLGPPRGRVSSPKEELERTKEIFENLPYPDKYATLPKGSLDDLYKGSRDKRDLNELYGGWRTGKQGSDGKPIPPEPSPMSEAQKIEEKRIRLNKEQNERTFKTRQLVHEEELAKEELKKDAEAKVRERLNRIVELQKQAS